MFRPVSAAVSAMTVLGLAPAVAWAAPDQSVLDQTTQASPVETGEGEAITDIVVTARRQAERLQQTPIAVTALSGATLERQQIVDVAALQNAAPNLGIRTQTGDPNSVIVTMRGQVQSDGLITLDPAVGLYLDGIYVARSTGGLLNLVDMERVEILRGPQGTLFGRNTTGGAINLVTRMPTGEFGGNVAIKIGTFGLVEGTAVVNVPISEQAAFRVVGQRSSRNGYARNLFRDSQLADDDLSTVRGTLRVNSADSRFELLLSGDYTDRDNSGQFSRLVLVTPTSNVDSTTIAACAAGPNPLCSVSRPSDTVRNYLNVDYYRNNGNDPAFTRSSSGGASATATMELGSASIKAISAYRFTKLDRTADLDGTPYTLLTSTGAVDQTQFSQELQLYGKALADRLNWIGGLFYFRESGNDGSATKLGVPTSTTAFTLLGYARNTSYAAYGQLNFDVTERLRITAGTRYTWDTRFLRSNAVSVSLLTGAAPCVFAPAIIDAGANCLSSHEVKYNYPSFTLSADYRVTPDVMVYGSVNRASRAGGFNLRFTNAATARPFAPEKVTSYEAGVKSEWFDHRLRVNATAFYASYDDIQRTRIALVDGGLVSLVQNAAKAHVYGAEAEIIALPVQGLQLNGALGYTKPVYDEFTDALGTDRRGEPFLLVPRFTANVGAELTQSLSTGKFTLRADYSYRSAIYFNPNANARQPAYGLANLSATYELDSPHLGFGLWVRNLGDERYYDRMTDLSSQAIGIVTGIPGAPRTFGGTITYKF